VSRDAVPNLSASGFAPLSCILFVALVSACAHCRPWYRLTPGLRRSGSFDRRNLYSGSILDRYTGLVSLGSNGSRVGGYGIAIGTGVLGWPLWVIRSCPRWWWWRRFAAAIGRDLHPAPRRRVSDDHSAFSTNVLWCRVKLRTDQRLRRHDRHPASGPVFFAVASGRQAGYLLLHVLTVSVLALLLCGGIR